MNFANCKLFCDVVRCRSFTEGARLNGITQSAASQAIHHLERLFEAQLIDRTKRPFDLTAEGQICYEALVDILTRYEKARADVKSLHENVTGLVRVAAIYSVGLHDMAATMQRFMARYGRAKVKLEYQLPHKVYEAVLHASADLGIVSYPRETRELSVIPLRSEKMRLVCHPEHPFTARKAVTPRQLDGQDFIAFDRELPICRELDRYFLDNRITLHKVMEFDNIETIKQAVEIGTGLSILPEPTVRAEIASGSLVAVRLTGCDLERPIGIIHRHRKAFTPVMRRFVEALCEQADIGQD